LEVLQTTIGEAIDKVESIRGKVEELTTNVNEISLNVKDKLHAADALFEAARDAGATIQETAHTAKELTGQLSRAVKERAREKENNWTKWVQTGIRLEGVVRSSLKSRRESSSGRLSSSET
jgi:uncharacterized protein YoxC